jgi:hypothetical protein
MPRRPPNKYTRLRPSRAKDRSHRRQLLLQFAFDGDSKNPPCPGNYVSNTVVYTYP